MGTDELTTLPSPSCLMRLSDAAAKVYPVTAERLADLASELTVLEYKINSLLAVVERLPGLREPL